MIPQRTREKPSHIPSPTTIAIRVSLGQSCGPRRPRPRSLIMHPPPCRPNFLLLLQCSLSRSVTTLPLFIISFWMAYRDLSCALVPVPSLRHSSSTTCMTVISYLCNSFRYYPVLTSLFLSGSPFRRAILPLYHNTSHDCSQVPPRALTIFSNQECPSHPMSPRVPEAEVGEAN